MCAFYISTSPIFMTLCSVIRLINKILIVITEISVPMKLHYSRHCRYHISISYLYNIKVFCRHRFWSFASIMRSRETVSVRLFRRITLFIRGVHRELTESCVEFNEHIILCSTQMSATKALSRYDSNLTSYPAVDKIRLHGVIIFNYNIVGIHIVRATKPLKLRKFQKFRSTTTSLHPITLGCTSQRL